MLETLVLRRMMIWIVILLFLAALVGLLAWYVDDWSRDLTKNVASTSAAARDPLLHPLDLHRPVNEVMAAVQRAASSLPRWEQVSTEIDGVAQVIRFVRTTPLWRFKDDITVRISPNDVGCRVTVESRSRVGKADFGQNPRNIKELMEALRTLWRVSAPAANPPTS